MQYGLEKIILPSFYNQTPPEKLTRFLNWSIKTLIPIIKESDVEAVQPFVQLIKTYKLDLPKVLAFVNTYLDVYGITTKDKLMQLRNANLLSSSTAAILKDVERGYVFDHPFDAISVRSDHTDYRDATIRQIKGSYPTNQITNDGMFDLIFKGIICWAITNYQTPEMLESKRQELLAEKKKKEQEELRRKQLQEQQDKDKNKDKTPQTDDDIFTQIDWQNAVDLVTNSKNKVEIDSKGAEQNTTTPPLAPTPNINDSNSIDIDSQESISPKSSMNTIVRGVLVLTTTTLAIYGLTKLMSKNRE